MKIYKISFTISIMGNANIDPQLKKDIEEVLKKRKYKIKYQNVKGFIDNACARELEKIKKKKPKNI